MKLLKEYEIRKVMINWVNDNWEKISVEDGFGDGEMTKMARELAMNVNNVYDMGHLQFKAALISGLAFASDMMEQKSRSASCTRELDKRLAANAFTKTLIDNLEMMSATN